MYPILAASGRSNTAAVQFPDSGKTLFTNDNWTETEQAGIQATWLCSAQGLGVGYPHRFATGKYTAFYPARITTGIGLVEVYDIVGKVTRLLLLFHCLQLFN